MYDSGLGCAAGPRAGAEWYRKAAEHGDPTAQFNLGVMYGTGTGRSAGPRAGAAVVSQGGRAGRTRTRSSTSASSTRTAGASRRISPRPRSGTASAAEQGSANAQYALGVMYDTGRGVPQDYRAGAPVVSPGGGAGRRERAVRPRRDVRQRPGRRGRTSAQAVQWYRKAAEQGNAGAQYALGVMYDLGRGIARDYSQAVLWYRSAAEQGNASAQFNLGLSYRDGQGVAQDDVEALVWLNLAFMRVSGADQKKCADARAALIKKVTPAQFAEAQKRAQERTAALAAEHAVARASDHQFPCGEWPRWELAGLCEGEDQRVREASGLAAAEGRPSGVESIRPGPCDTNRHGGAVPATGLCLAGGMILARDDGAGEAMMRQFCLAVAVALLVLSGPASAQDQKTFSISTPSTSKGDRPPSTCPRPANRSWSMPAFRAGATPAASSTAVKQAGLKHLDYVVVTHYDIDHVGGISEVAAAIPVRNFVDYGNRLPSQQGPPPQGGAARMGGADRGNAPGAQGPPQGGADRGDVPGGAQAPRPPMMSAAQIDEGVQGGARQGESHRGQRRRPAVCQGPGHSGGIEPRPGHHQAASRGWRRESAVRRLRAASSGHDAEHQLRRHDHRRVRALPVDEHRRSTWNTEHDLACPRNLIGAVATCTSRPITGSRRSGLPALVQAVSPQAVLMNNGPRKGGSVETWDSLKKTKADVWQLHYSVKRVPRRRTSRRRPTRGRTGLQRAGAVRCQYGGSREPLAGVQPEGLGPPGRQLHGHQPPQRVQKEYKPRTK